MITGNEILNRVIDTAIDEPVESEQSDYLDRIGALESDNIEPEGYQNIYRVDVSDVDLSSRRASREYHNPYIESNSSHIMPHVADQRISIKTYQGNREYNVSVPVSSDHVQMINRSQGIESNITNTKVGLLNYILNDVARLVHNIVIDNNGKAPHQMILDVVNGYLLRMQEMVMFGYYTGIRMVTERFSQVLSVRIEVIIDGEKRTLHRDVDIDIM